MGKANKKPQIKKQGQSFSIVTPVDYGSVGEHTDYSGYGYHGKNRRAHRRDRTMEEKRVQKGGWMND